MAAKKKKAAKSAPHKRAPKKPAAKKAAPKKPAAKKAAPKKPAAKKAAPKKPAAKKAAPKKPAAKKAAAKKPAPKKPAPVLVAPRPVVPPGPPDPTIDLAQAVAALALDKKAEEVLILKVTDLTSYADCFILASAPSERQVQSIARHVADEMKKAGKAPAGTEGLEQGHWVLVDLGAIVLHVFLASARRYYDLEGFWSDAPRVEIDETRGLAIVAAMTKAQAARNVTRGEGVGANDSDQPAAHDA